MATQVSGCCKSLASHAVQTQTCNRSVDPDTKMGMVEVMALDRVEVMPMACSPAVKLLSISPVIRHHETAPSRYLRLIVCYIAT